jgi:hypothetical protein
MQVGKISDKWEAYFDRYSQKLECLRDSPISMLEIGVQNGGSLEVWSRYFPGAQAIVGCDIDARCADLRYDDERVKVVVGDASRKETQQQIAAVCPAFDLVIDDGSHIARHVLAAFALYFPMLKPGGLYVVEDTHTLYSPRYGGGLDSPGNAYGFFKALADIVNLAHWHGPMSVERVLEFLAVHTGGQAVPESVALGWVEGVEFRNSMLTIYKAKNAGHSKLGQRLICGTEGLICGAEKLASPR